MADLRAVFEGLGFRDVVTVLNSGNVVFSAAAGSGESLRSRIEKALVAQLRLTVPVTVLSTEEISAVVRNNPLARVATNPSALLVVVPLEPSGLGSLRPLLGRPWSPESLALGRRVAYLWCARGVAKSPLWSAVDRALARSGTARNIATMKRLVTAAGDVS